MGGRVRYKHVCCAKVNTLLLGYRVVMRLLLTAYRDDTEIHGWLLDSKAKNLANIELMAAIMQGTPTYDTRMTAQRNNQRHDDFIRRLREFDTLLLDVQAAVTHMQQYIVVAVTRLSSENVSLLSSSWDSIKGFNALYTQASKVFDGIPH
jgi:hypothetical protein